MTARILLAEDNESLSQMLQKFLAGQGCDVVAVRTGLEVLQSLTAGSFDLLVLDLRLPGLSGADVLQKLRKSEKWAEFPVIVITGVYKGDKYAEAARRLGVKHYLEKPFTQQAFINAVQSTLRPPPPEKDASTLRDLLVDVYEAGKSGILAFPQGSPVAFLKGEPISFMTQGKGDFRDHLVARGKITLADRKAFLAGGEERLFITQAGLLTYDELAEESRLFLTKKLVDALDVKSGISFSEGMPPLESPLVPISIPHLIYEASKSRGNQLHGQAFMERFAGCYPARTPLFFRRANLVTMRQGDIELLELMDGQRTLQQIIAKGAVPHEAATFFHFLHSLGMLAMHEKPTANTTADFLQKDLFNRPLEEIAADDGQAVGFDDLVEELSGTVELAVGNEGMASPLSSDEIGFEQTVQRDHAFIKDKNYYELFGLSPNSFSFNALKEAYFSKTRQYSPEKFMELSGATQSLAQDVLAIYANAYNTLSSVVAKERYDEMLNADRVGLDGRQDDKLQAKIQFQSGKVFLEMGEFENAQKALQDSFTLEPDNPQHCAYLAWAIYNNPASKNSKAAQERARMLLAKSVQIGKVAEAFAFRGWMLLDEGRDGLAEGEFQKALRINPKDSYAVKGIRQITEKREAESKGFFRKIFG
jgi:CheY-like chemotaxis protein/tetratricopeptide (TPR) repeat protein